MNLFFADMIGDQHNDHIADSQASEGADYAFGRAESQSELS